MGEAEPVLRALRPLAGTRLDAECYAALVASLAGAPLVTLSRSRRERGASLTEREREVLLLVGEGLSNRAIAQKLVLSEKTVEHHLEHIFNRLGVSSRTAAVVYALQQGLVGYG
jgi:DNA-binding NarL/FixJ family response regulator